MSISNLSTIGFLEDDDDDDMLWLVRGVGGGGGGGGQMKDGKWEGKNSEKTERKWRCSVEGEEKE